MTPDQWLIAVLRGDAVAVRAQPMDADDVVLTAVHHSVLPLIADTLRTRPHLAGDAVNGRLQKIAVQHAAADMERERELRAVLRALEAEWTSPIVFKGAHLAYACYGRPDLRPRVDTDILIDPTPAARAAAHRALLALGYSTPPHAGGDLVMTQRSYTKRRASRLVHAVDVHWRLANPQAFAAVLEHDELLRDAVSIHALGPAARGPSLLHALVIACVHRVAHHADADCLIWLYDIDQVARRLTRAEWREFDRLIVERGIATVCRASLRRTADTFCTPIPPVLFDPSPASETDERTARFLDGPRGSAEAAVEDFRAMDSWSGRMRLAREHLLPPAAYMREVYAPASRAPLAWLYARRVLTGAGRWLISRR